MLLIVALDRIAFLFAGCRRQARELAGQSRRECFHRRTLGGIVPGQNQSNPQVTSFQASMKSGLASQQGLAASAVSVSQKLGSGSTGNPNAFDSLRKVTHELNLRLMQSLLDEAIQFAKRHWLRKLAEATAA
jgi:hypothetical protein